MADEKIRAEQEEEEAEVEGHGNIGGDKSEGQSGGHHDEEPEVEGHGNIGNLRAGSSGQDRARGNSGG